MNACNHRVKAQSRRGMQLQTQDAYFGCIAQAAAGGPRVALRVVSLNAEATNRGPTFDMDLAELETPEGNPHTLREGARLLQARPRAQARIWDFTGFMFPWYPCLAHPHTGNP